MHVDDGTPAAHGRAAVGVLDVDARAAEALGDPGERAGLVGHVEREDGGAHRQHAAVAEQVERLLRLAHHQADDGVVHQVRDGERADADPVAGQVGGQLRQHARAVLEERRELRLHPHRLTSPPLPRTGRGATFQGEPPVLFGLAPAAADRYTCACFSLGARTRTMESTGYSG